MILEPLSKPLQALHLAGIVPIAGQEDIFNMPWHDSLMPIGANYTLLEKAVFECAAVGCETIWVVAHAGTMPLVKKRLGDFIIDPEVEKTHRYFAIREVPIYYVPIHPKDRDRRDCLGWSVMYGAKVAYGTSDFLSKWVAPELFYCSFPYSLNSVDEAKTIRTRLFNKQRILFTHNGKSVKDDMHLNFSFNAKDYFKCRDILRKRDIDTWDKKKIRTKNYNLAEVFKGLDEEDTEKVELSWHYDINSWDNYRNYLSSEQAKSINKPFKFFSKNKKARYIDYVQQTSREDLQQSESLPEAENKST